MLLTPRYGPTPVLGLDGDPAAIGDLVVRQRRRFVRLASELDDEQWEQPSRCEAWAARDVAAHLATTNVYWEASIRAGLAGEPTRLMTGFDPVASPAQAAAASTASTAEIVDAVSSTTESLATCLEELDDTEWATIAESPPGHVTISTVAHHALWDSWIHERDVMLPLGLDPGDEADEVVACLRYVAGFTAALAVNAGATTTGAFDVAATHPEVAFHVEVGSEVAVTDGLADTGFTLDGDAVELVEALSFRAPMTKQIPESVDWMFSGLATAFDR